jgi:serine phosphatase RsbU (regulator of sigma subunit)/pSer/pThr/pTyr-binding forkhead associated (FHA) protein
MPELTIRSLDGRSETIKLTEGSLTLGRSHDNGLSYPDDGSLSRHHLVLERDGEAWLVRDLGSKNGTLVNGVRLDGAHRLHPGDRIAAGRILLTYDPGSGVSPDKVVFLPDSNQETPMGQTVVTSLDRLLSTDKTGPVVRVERPGVGQAAGVSYQHPAVSALVRAGRELVGDRPLNELFELILNLSIDAVGGERGVLMTLERDQLLPQALRGEGLRISSAVRDSVLSSKNSLLVRDTSLEEAFRERQSINEQQVRTMMAAPLQTDDRVIGLIYVDSRSFVREFSPDDLNLLTVLANVAAIKIEHERLAVVEENERQHRVELDQAAEIQRRLLPEKAPVIPGIELLGLNEQCRTVGGDYYDFFAYPDGRVAAVLGDVSGKGMPAALLVGNLQARLQFLAEEPEDLGRLVSRLDRSMAANCPSNRFVSLFIFVIDPKSEEMNYCNAGHNPPLVVHADGSVEKLETGGLLIGILPGRGYEQGQCRLGKGDLVFVFSDGLSEATNPDNEEFGEDRLAELLCRHRTEPVATLLETVKKTLDEWTAGAPPADDLTMVVARRTA